VVAALTLPPTLVLPPGVTAGDDDCGFGPPALGLVLPDGFTVDPGAPLTLGPAVP
jgi:hypothetical protein